MKLSTATVDVAILGAGVSGLRAAQVLRQQGCRNVVIVEARNRAGGRIRWTHMPPSSSPQGGDGVYLDEGAQFIHGVHGKNPTIKLAKEHKISYRKIDWDDGYMFIGPNQQELPPTQQRKDEKAHEAVRRKLYKWQKVQTKSENPKDESLESVLAPLVAEQGGSDLSAQQRLWSILRTSISDDYGDDLSNLSAMYFDQEEELPGGDAVPHTYQKLVEAMLLPAENTEDVLLYQHVVQKIIFPQTDEPVRIHCRQTDTDENVEIQAKRVICTLPLGVLKQQQSTLFHPALPQSLQDSIQRLGYGCLEKVWLRFSCDPFWPTDADVFYHYASETPFRVWFLPARVYRNPAYRRTLCCFVSGTAARSMGQESAAATSEQILAALREILPVPDPTNTQSPQL
eukprot:scaffold45095_cov176-Amphora_coffeaeformis.AAC.1